MSMDNLNKWLTLVANIGVLAGIVFLGIELQQNTNMMQAQTRDSVNQNTNQAYNLLAGDLELADIIVRGNAGNLVFELNAEWLAYSSFMSMGLRNWENEYYQYEQGLFEDSEFLPRKQAWGRYLLAPGPRQVWASVREDYSNNFRNVIDQLVGEIE